MINNVLYYVNTFSDFLDLVREHMGEDSYHYLEKFNDKYESLKELETISLSLVDDLDDFNSSFIELKEDFDSIMNNILNVSEV